MAAQVMVEMRAELRQPKVGEECAGDLNWVRAAGSALFNLGRARR